MSINKLMTGIKQYRETRFQDQRPEIQRLVDEGQTPAILMVSCADSRIDPSIIFNCDPGDIFVVRNVANIVPGYRPDGQPHSVAAALEYGVQSLGISDIVIMGHAHCGGVNALLEAHGTEGGISAVGEFVGPWMAEAESICDKVNKDDFPERAALNRAMEQENVKLGLENLMTFPWIAERVADGRLTLHGWRFDVGACELQKYDADQGGFVTIGD